MDAKEKAIIERFITKFPAMYSLDIAEIIGVSQKDVLQVRRELQDKSKLAYIGGMELDKDIPDEAEDI